MDEFEKKATILWSILLAVSTILMLFLLITGEDSLNFTLIIYLIVVKFLGGFGIAMGITSMFIFILTKYEVKFQGEENKKKLNNLLIFIVVLFIGLLIYQGPVKIYQSVTEHGDSDSIFDKILFIYGIVSLLVSLYIKPLINDNFLTVTTVTTGEMMKKGFKETLRGLKKGIFKLKKNYGKAVLEEQQSSKELIQVWRQRLAVIVMPILGFGCLVFSPIALIMIGGWLRIFYYNDHHLLKLEKNLLIVGSIAITIISILIPFVLNFTPFYTIIQLNYFWVYIFQFLGMMLAAVLYLTRLLKPMIDSHRKKQIKDLKTQREELKQKQKDLQKEKKQMEKEIVQLKKEKEKKK